MFQAASDTTPQRVLLAPQRPVESQRLSLQKVSFISMFPDRRVGTEWTWSRQQSSGPLFTFCRSSSVSAVVTR